MYDRWKVKKNLWLSSVQENGTICLHSDSMSCFVVVYFLTAITYMYLAFTSKKQVLKGLLRGNQKRTFALSKRELRLRESE